jgi:hypothetical protein
MKDNSGYDNIPHAFFDFITFLTDALPLRSVPTFIELLVGAMLTQHGFVTHAWLAIDPLRHWTTYYKWIECGKWSWVNIARRLMRMLTVFFPEEERFLTLDDINPANKCINLESFVLYCVHGKNRCTQTQPRNSI